MDIDFSFKEMRTLAVPTNSLKSFPSAETLLSQERAGTNKNMPAVGVQSSQSDSLMDIRRNRTPVKTNFHHIGKELFFPVSGINIDTLRATEDLPLPWKQGSPYKKSTPIIYGRSVRVNGRDIALFLFREELFAVDGICPHMGGPLHLGDIEDTISGLTGQLSPCVVCPWHKWCFELSTGRQIRPAGNEKHIQSYPVQVDLNGDISIGFTSFEPLCFTDTDF